MRSGWAGRAAEWRTASKAEPERAGGKNYFSGDGAACLLLNVRRFPSRTHLKSQLGLVAVESSRSDPKLIDKRTPKKRKRRKRGIWARNSTRGRFFLVAS